MFLSVSCRACSLCSGERNYRSERLIVYNMAAVCVCLAPLDPCISSACQRLAGEVGKGRRGRERGREGGEKQLPRDRRRTTLDHCQQHQQQYIVTSVWCQTYYFCSCSGVSNISRRPDCVLRIIESTCVNRQLFCGSNLAYRTF